MLGKLLGKCSDLSYQLLIHLHEMKPDYTEESPHRNVARWRSSNKVKVAHYIEAEHNYQVIAVLVINPQSNVNNKSFSTSVDAQKHLEHKHKSSKIRQRR